MRLTLCLLLVGASAVSAQDASDLNQRLRDAASQTDTLVLSVTEQEGGGVVYDLSGEGGTRAFVFHTTGAFIVRAPDADRVLVVVEPFGLPATSTASEVPQLYTGLAGPNVAVLTPDAPIAEFRLREVGLSDFSGDPDAPIATYHRVRVLACTDSQGPACRTWTSARPRSGGGDLYVIVVDGPTAR